MNASPISLDRSPMYGIGLKVLSVVVFVGMQSLIKAGGRGIPAGELVFFRSFFALVPVALYLLWLGTLRTALRTDDFGGHLVRGLIGVTSMGLGFFALGQLPYPEWIAISYASPLMTVIFAALFLRETVRAYRWSAVLVGLIGILVVAAPGFTLFGDAPLPVAHRLGIVASLVGAAFSAVAMIQIRRLVRTEPTTTIVVYFTLTSSGIALLLTAPFGWVWPSPWQATLLVGAGLCGGVGQLLMTACYRYADASTIAPFEYTSLLLAIAVGALVFGEPASPTTLLGSVIVIAAGIFIIHRERKLGIERKGPRSTSTPHG